LVREVASSLAKTLPRWYCTVRVLMNSWRRSRDWRGRHGPNGRPGPPGPDPTRAAKSTPGLAVGNRPSPRCRSPVRSIQRPSMGLLRRPTTSNLVEDRRFSRPCGRVRITEPPGSLTHAPVVVTRRDRRRPWTAQRSSPGRSCRTRRPSRAPACSEARPSPMMGSGPASPSSPVGPRPAGTTTGTTPPTPTSPAAG
jgi:hypothetical protein